MFSHPCSRGDRQTEEKKGGVFIEMAQTGRPPPLLYHSITHEHQVL